MMTDGDRYVFLLRQLNIYLDMVSQMKNTGLPVMEGGCEYFTMMSHKIVELEVAIIAMNTIYKTQYEQYKEESTNG